MLVMAARWSALRSDLLKTNGVSITPTEAIHPFGSFGGPWGNPAVGYVVRLVGCPSCCGATGAYILGRGVW